MHSSQVENEPQPEPVEPEPMPAPAPAPVPEQPQQFSMTFDQLQALMKAVSEGNKEAMIAFAQEMKKPTQKELDAEAKKEEDYQKQRAEMVKLAAQEVAQKEAMQRMCNHKKNFGKSAKFNYAGQVHSDGRVKIICKLCGKTLVDRPATQDDYQMGPLEIVNQEAEVMM